MQGVEPSNQWSVGHEAPTSHRVLSPITCHLTLAASYHLLLAGVINEDFGSKGDAKPVTILAPTNSAYNSVLACLNIAYGSPLKDNSLKRILQHHIICDVNTIGTLKDQQLVTTALNHSDDSNLTFRRCNGTIAFTSTSDGQWADVVTQDIKAGQSVVHIIDKVLVPPEMKDASKCGSGSG